MNMHSLFRSLCVVILSICCSIVLILATPLPSQAQDKIELFGGYSYFRASVREVQSSPTASTLINERTNLNGWELAGQYKLLPFLGAVADFNGTYGTLRGARTREHTFLVGPQVSLPARVSPFAHALFGVAKESQDPIAQSCPALTCTSFGSLGTGTSFASALGAGIDVKLNRFLKIRLIQMDYVRTTLHGATQNQPRASAGIIFHF